MLPKVDRDEGGKDEKGECFLCWENDDEDALEKVQSVVETILNTIDNTPDILSNFLLQKLVDSEVYHPQAKSIRENQDEESVDEVTSDIYHQTWQE